VAPTTAVGAAAVSRTGDHTAIVAGSTTADSGTAVHREDDLLQPVIQQPSASPHTSLSRDDAHSPVVPRLLIDAATGSLPGTALPLTPLAGIPGSSNGALDSSRTGANLLFELINPATASDRVVNTDDGHPVAVPRDVNSQAAAVISTGGGATEIMSNHAGARGSVMSTGAVELQVRDDEAHEVA